MAIDSRQFDRAILGSAAQVTQIGRDEIRSATGVENALNSLGSEVDALREVWDALRARVGPALRPSGPEAPPHPGKPVGELLCPIAEVITHTRARISDLKEEMVSIMHRVDL